MDFRQTVDYIMAAISEEYPGKFKITKPRAKMWRQMLKEFSNDVIMAAAYQIISTNDDQWPPTIGMIRNKAVQFSHGELHAPTGQEAWENVLKKFQFEDYPLTDMEKAALAQVGMIYDLKRSTNTTADRANFVRAFDNLVAKQQIERATPSSVKALVEQNVPFLPAAEEEKPALPESTEQDDGRPPLPARTEGGSEYPTKEEVAGYVKELSEKIALKEQQDREETAERLAIETEALDRR